MTRSNLSVKREPFQFAVRVVSLADIVDQVPVLFGEFERAAVGRRVPCLHVIVKGQHAPPLARHTRCRAMCLRFDRARIQVVVEVLAEHRGMHPCDVAAIRAPRTAWSVRLLASVWVPLAEEVVK
jgi:hypothetical protein